MRSFIKKFHIKLSKKKREQLKANSEKAKVVVRKRKPHGSFTVSCPQLFHPSFKHIQNLCRTFPVGWNSSNNTFGFTMFFFHMVARDRNRFRVKDSRWLTLLVPSRLRSGGPGLKKTQVYPALYGERMCKFHKAHTDRDRVFNSVCCGGFFGSCAVSLCRIPKDCTSALSSRPLSIKSNVRGKSQPESDFPDPKVWK